MNFSTGTVVIIFVYQIIQKLSLAKLDKYFETFNYCAVQPSDRKIFLKDIRSYDLTCGIPGEVFCTWQCNKDPKCMHFNYKPVSLSCEMYYNDQSCFLRTTNCIFYQVTDSELTAMQQWRNLDLAGPRAKNTGRAPSWLEYLVSDF